MADWTDIANESIEPDAPAISSLFFALRDNPKAIAEGASGAPRIVNGAVANSTLGAEKFQSGNDERDWVLARCAAASVGAVGTYAMCKIDRDQNDILSAGSTVGGSALMYAGINGDGIVTSSSPGGTWRLMGFIRGVNNAGINPVVSMWLRIS